MKTRAAAAWKTILLWIPVLLISAAPAHSAVLDLTHAVVVAPAELTAVEQQAVVMLMDEVGKRTLITWTRTNRWPSSEAAVIALGSVAALKQAGVPLDEIAQADGPAEGYQLRAVKADRSPGVLIVGNDPRGVLFGVGRLLRELRMTRTKVELSDTLAITAAPSYPLRGHQLGYRPKTNSYDAWDVAAWEQYLRDLVIFGCNAIELIPPRSDDDADSPQFPLPPMRMMVEMSRLADRYGMDVWIWYPAMDKDYADPATVQSALKEWAEVFRQLPRVDAVFVPGGDPGHTQPRHLMALLEQQTRNLRQFHPTAKMWVSPQSFNDRWLDEFTAILRDQRPNWLGGVVFGPQVRVPLPVLRTLIPAQYPIRHYPDITHSRQCQYPVPNWDVAYAVTEARECINPRPEDEAAIFRATAEQTIGFISYSEGCNDDVNKAIWSALGWDPQAKAVDILREYSRFFIGEPFAEGFAQGLLALERNWRGPLLANADVDTTLQQFQALERAASPAQLKNWRFQQGLFRAYYDAYTRVRLLRETDAEKQALARVRQASDMGSREAMSAAQAILDAARSDVTAQDWRQRILELGAALFQSIGMQLSVSKYHAIAVDRGAALDTLDFPVNNRLWLAEQFARIQRLSSERERIHALQQLVDWENPGPGGFYDDLGNSARQPHLVRLATFAEDPGAFRSPRVDFEEDLVIDEDDLAPQGVRRLSWMDHAEILYDAPLQLKYTGLDTNAHYRVRAVYAGDNPKRKLRLVANDGVEVHPLMSKPFPFRPVEFELPRAATESGALTLSWYGEPGLGGNGRGAQVSEVWLIQGQ